MISNKLKITKQNNIFIAFLKDVFLGWSKKEAIYALSLIALQIITFVLNPDSISGFITGLSGTICVILAAKRKISNYAFGFIQTAVGLYLGLQVHLWGESAENLFYLITQFIGFAAWRKHMIAGDSEEETEQVETRKFSLKHWAMSLIIIGIGTLGFAFVSQHMTEIINSLGSFASLVGNIFGQHWGWTVTNMQGTQPYIDAFTLVVAFVAQIIMLERYREQWVFWFALNIVSLYQWFTLNNMSMVALYIAFLINNAYGYYQWSKGIR